MNKLLVIDGNNLVRRFAAVPAFARLSYKGQPTGAIHGSVDCVLSLIEKYKPTEIAIVFDGIGAKEKKQQTTYAGYKANRGGMEDSTADQLHATRDLFRALGIAVYQQPQVDADDVIGTLSRLHIVLGASARRSVMIYSNDKDFFQLVDDHTCVIRPHDGLWYSERVCEEFGVREPRLFAHYLALTGDGVDGIPGLPKIGPKTAKEWMQQYGTLQALVRDYQGTKRAMIDENRENLKTYLKLTQINCKLFTPKHAEMAAAKLKPQSFTDRLIPMLRQHGLFKLESRLNGRETVLSAPRSMFS